MLEWLASTPAPAGVTIVWLPMIPTDSAAEACSSAAHFDDPRVVQFWDPDRLTGRSWSVDFQAPIARAMLDSVDSEYRPFVERWIADPASQPMWDVAYFYAPNVRWRDRVPAPIAWTKQLGFWGVEEEADSTAVDPGVAPSEADPVTGQFWTDRKPGGLLPSDWIREFARGMARVAPAHRRR